MPLLLFRRHLAIHLVAVLSLLPGCAQHSVTVPLRPPPLSEQARAQLGTVGVLSIPFNPEVSIEVRSTDGSSEAGSGAAAGGLGGTAVGAAGAVAVLPLGLVFPPMFLVAGGIFVASVMGGTLMGKAYDAVPADGAAAGVGPGAAFKAGLADPTVEAGMSAHIQFAAAGLPSHRVVLLRESDGVSSLAQSDYRALVERRIDSLLIVQIEQVRVTMEEDVDAPMALDMTVKSTLIRTRDGAKLDERIFTCRGGKRTLSQWRAESVTPFTAGLSRCYHKVADRIVEEVFLVYDLPGGIRWRFGGRGFATVATDSLQPTFRWGSFRVATGSKRDQQGLLSRSEDVTYDLKVWRADSNTFPSDLVYARDGLSSPSHLVEDVLEPSTTYFWTVRARFDLDGQTRVTPWAVTLARTGYSPEQFDRVTNDFYYRFKTPPSQHEEAIVSQAPQPLPSEN